MQKQIDHEGVRRVSDGVFVTHLALIVCIAIGAVLLAACSWTRIENNNQQAQGLTNSSSLPSPEPSAECALGSIGPGTAGDATEIPAGGTLAIGVSLFGPQGIELVESCLSRYSAAWETLAGPCTFAGSHNGLATAPASATPGSVCLGGVNVSDRNGSVSKHGELSLVVR